MLKVSPIRLLVANRLVTGGDGAYLVEFRLEQLDKQPNDNQGGDGEKPDGFNVSLVVAKVVGK